MTDMRARLTQEPAGRTPGGRAFSVFTFCNPDGMEVRVLTYGGIVMSIRTRIAKAAWATWSLATTHRPAISQPTYFGALIRPLWIAWLTVPLGWMAGLLARQERRPPSSAWRPNRVGPGRVGGPIIPGFGRVRRHVDPPQPRWRRGIPWGGGCEGHLPADR